MQLAPVADIRGNSRKVVAESWLERDRRDRIVVALGSVRHIPRVGDESLSRYYEYLMEHLLLPVHRSLPRTNDLPGRSGIPLHRADLLDPSKTWATGLTASSPRPARGSVRSLFR